MNNFHYQIAKRYMQETHEQARRDALVRTFRPSVRAQVATTLRNLATHSTPNKPQQESWL